MVFKISLKLKIITCKLRIIFLIEIGLKNNISMEKNFPNYFITCYIVEFLNIMKIKCIIKNFVIFLWSNTKLITLNMVIWKDEMMKAGECIDLRVDMEKQSIL